MDNSICEKLSNTFLCKCASWISLLIYVCLSETKFPFVREQNMEAAKAIERLLKLAVSIHFLSFKNVVVFLGLLSCSLHFVDSKPSSVVVFFLPHFPFLVELDGWTAALCGSQFLLGLVEFKQYWYILAQLEYACSSLGCEVNIFVSSCTEPNCWMLINHLLSILGTYLFHSLRLDILALLLQLQYFSLVPSSTNI